MSSEMVTLTSNRTPSNRGKARDDPKNQGFYAYDSSTTVSQFLSYFEMQSSNYPGGKLLASVSTDSSGGGLSPAKGFFSAYKLSRSKGSCRVFLCGLPMIP
ncbi:hypothetical protein KSP40_PGU005390 [Platanthera guangdongensis]|uniref:Uncharacterized protein n=1 Tax=Platanthera guangdongensis TaxID=2320717 RepID=A0ABR2N3L4_9ASPA